MTSRARAFTFTINNDTYDDLSLFIHHQPYRYICFGFEKGDKTQTEHIQGYVYFDNLHSMKQVSKIFPRAHLEIAKGNLYQNKDYTSKERNWYEFGEEPEQGRAKMNYIEALMEDPSLNFHLYNQYRKSYKEYKLTLKKDHRRLLYIIHEDEKYVVAKHFSSVMIDDHENYTDEDTLMLPAYSSFNVIQWCNGYPPSTKRGYEILKIDPEYLFIYYTTLQERNYLIKKYSEYIDHNATWYKEFEEHRDSLNEEVEEGSEEGN